DSTARLDVSGELAVSSPDPNRAGATYLDDFEATDEIPLSLDAFEWDLGSAPRDATAVPGLPTPPSPGNAAQLVWQDRYLLAGEERGFLTPDLIDDQIALAGARLAERVLYLTMGGGPRPVEAPQWRSITTVLSTTGRDLSRSEFLEFYAAPWAGPVEDVTLVIDIGSVSEDAYYVDETGAVQGTTEFGQPWGLGVLDEEAQLALREVWGPEHDRQGLWDQSCEADRLNPVPLGDPRANCTVLNGRPDTEDLNANGVLDGMDGPSFRYVVPIGRDSPYLVRDENATGSELGFRLFRIPLRGPGAIPLNGASDASWRFVKHIRLTLVKPTTGEGTVALARLRIAGSRWTKRNVEGVVAGLLGDVPGSGSATADVRVGPVSQLTDGAAYRSPPGVGDELQDPSSALGASGVEFNEKSLRLSWDALPADERAEVYFRYPQQPRSFLEYRQLRFWAVPRSGSWGPGGDLQLLVKAGTDPRNYYLYRTRLRDAVTSDVQPGDWDPELIIDFAEWFRLKAEAERRLAASGGGPLTVWSADSTYAIVLEDRARAPNLAGVRELGFAVYNGGGVTSAGEVWIDDLRLGGGVRDAGLAGRVDLDLDAGGVFAAAVSFGGRGGRFRQLDGAPTYETVDELSVHTTTQLGRLAPESWGVSMPVTVSYQRTRLDPIFLQGTDIRAAELPELRETGSTRRRVGVSLRKTTPSANPVVGALIDGTSVRLGYLATEDATVTTKSRLDGLDGGIEVDRAVGTVDVDVVPGFLEAILRWLAPRRLERSPFFERLTGARLRLTPERIGLSGGYTRQDARIWRYDRVLESPGDPDIRPIESPRRSLQGGASVALRPLESLTARFGVVTARDVLDPDRATPIDSVRQALRRASSEVAGIPLGWERDRVVTADVGFRPGIADWLRPSVDWTSRYGQWQNPSYLTRVATPDGEVAELLRTFNVDRRLSRGVVFDLPAALRATVGPATGPAPDSAAPVPPLPARLLLAAVGPLKPVELTWTDEVGSRFDRDLARPGLDFQLGLGTIDDVLRLADDTAATALRRDGFRARSGIRIGASAALDVGYTEMDTRVYDLRAGRRALLERSWPDLQLSWRDVPVPFWLEPALDSWSVSTGYVGTERATRLAGATPRIISQFEHTVPLELRLGFRGGLSLSYLGSLTLGDGDDPTGRTEQHALGHAVDLSGRFRPPGRLGDRLVEPVRLSLAYDYQERRQSRAVGRQDPTRFIDHLNRRVNLNLSTLISRMDIGLQVSYVDRRNFIGTQVGSSQFQLGLFGQFDMQAGRFDNR
ncbi:MAG: hypothetical protein GWM90_14530, partial [Gemmatimonadetes bacterium]|nr:hypothetical protein [Gemmatimonadota bacterium]NIQ55386.1 hypothetical protein [Gemmatimonadota bacterium]NIU75593.1 hypothetical protein [Gammaproteobacteria bacterium]NIX45283.1 hypothetical protein [Gemmatimonadota bacterium]NIY09566.1 hypothetical protein [Gemmatimonadota bacterium]